MKKATVVILSLFLQFVAVAHPFHVSITEIDLKKSSLQISVKVFIDDLEKSFTTRGKQKLQLGEKNEVPNCDILLTEYLNNSLLISINEKMKVYQYVGKEIENDAVWVYLEITKVKNVKSIEITNSILNELYDDQTNLVHTHIVGEKKSLILNKSTQTDKLIYQEK